MVMFAINNFGNNRIAGRNNWKFKSIIDWSLPVGYWTGFAQASGTSHKHSHHELGLAMKSILIYRGISVSLMLY